MSDRPRIETYEEFWPFYVREHSNKTNRRLHFIGSSGSIALAIAAILRKDPKYLLAALVSGYGGAWIGHFVFEKNKPASFKYPLWSFISDWKMYAMIATGRMDAEVERAIEQEAQKARDAAKAAERASRAEAAAPRPQDLN